MTTVEQFSAAYYIGNFNVESYNGDEVVVPYDMFETISFQVYQSPMPIPLVLKIGGVHTVAVGQQGIPADTVAIPKEHVETFDVDVPDRSDVLVARQERAAQIASWVLEDMGYGHF